MKKLMVFQMNGITPLNGERAEISLDPFDYVLSVKKKKSAHKYSILVSRFVFIFQNGMS